MEQLLQNKFKKNGKVYQNISSPPTDTTNTQITDLKVIGTTLYYSTDGGTTFAPVTSSTDLTDYYTKEQTNAAIATAIQNAIDGTWEASY